MSMNITVINGTPRKQGRTGIVARYLSKQYGCSLIDLSDGSIPLYTGEREQSELEAVRSLKQKVQDADAVILCSPEYHSGMSGALKNAMDFMGSDQFAHKPVAIIACSGGGKGGINCLTNLRTVSRGVYANVIPRQLVLDPHCFDREKDTLLSDPEALVEGMMKELMVYAEAHASIRGKLVQP